MAAEQREADGTGRRPLWLLFLDRTNLTVTSLTACFLAHTRSVGVAYFVAGAVMTSLTVKVLKRILRQPRPVNIVPALQKGSKNYGMPSTHSATITYYATYVPLACLYLPIHPSLPDNRLMRYVPPAIIIPWAMLICVSRNWLGHHSWPQVAVGCLHGLAFACFWFSLWTHGLSARGVDLEQYMDVYLGWR
ncbi:PAP2-domain-containing protein [Athelia psychrophila]|uniref:PAP2-domain-containing protein n=1 Tax=Athelia psychrophila TaxID=1759441 RepID=A0A166NVD2_9AGAM|nr:PAP2-domain-containing protein [Fibularhizoctonia sp. CBS 109695]